MLFLLTALGTSEFTQVPSFSSTVMKGHFSWDAFLNIWKHLLFAGDGFAGARSIDSAMLSLKHETFQQIHPDSDHLFGLQLHLWNVLFGKLRRNFFSLCLSRWRRAVPRANLHISVFHECAPHPSVAWVSSGTKASATLWKNRKGHVCCFINERIWNF